MKEYPRSDESKTSRQAVAEYLERRGVSCEV